MRTAGCPSEVVTSNTLWDKKLTIAGDGRLAVTEDGSENLTSPSSYPITRYLLDSSLKFSASGLNLTLSLPLYSDPSVKRTYANRFTGFSLDHLAGATWPTDYTSDITSYTWKANLTFNLPGEKKTKLLDSLSISAAQASAVFTWRSLDSQYAYRVSSVTLPSFTASMGGTLFSTVKEAGTKKRRLHRNLTNRRKPASEETADVTLQNLLKTAFRPTVATRSATTGTRYAKLTYSLNEQFTQSASSVSNQFDWDATHYLYSLTRGSLTFDSVVDPLLLTFTQTFTPSFTYTVDKSRETYRTLSFRVVSSTVSTIPVLGLTYSLTQQLYNYTESTTTDEVTTTDEAAFKFTFLLCDHPPDRLVKDHPDGKRNADAVGHLRAPTVDPEPDARVGLPEREPASFQFLQVCPRGRRNPCPGFDHGKTGLRRLGAGCSVHLELPE
ncbi:MAG: hypothetical protein LKE39_04320 [Sphaerochaeta sp.]|jgi:hypothetical protein|nr:hypothetical protein [Sphaerochaeta sp.]